MNGIRFYQEFSDESKRRAGDTVVAALTLNALPLATPVSVKICKTMA